MSVWTHAIGSCRQAAYRPVFVKGGLLVRLLALPSSEPPPWVSVSMLNYPELTRKPREITLLVNGKRVSKWPVGYIHQRDKGLCWICELSVPRFTRITALAPTRDHVVPHCDGGSNEEYNLRLAHNMCNVFRAKPPTQRIKNTAELKRRVAELLMILGAVHA